MPEAILSRPRRRRQASTGAVVSAALSTCTLLRRPLPCPLTPPTANPRCPTRPIPTHPRPCPFRSHHQRHLHYYSFKPPLSASVRSSQGKMDEVFYLGKTRVEDGAGGRESFYGVLVRAPVWCSPNFGDLDDECIVEECRRKGDSDLGEGASLERASLTDVRFLCIVRFLPYSCTTTIRCSLGHGQERRGHRNRGRHKLTP